MRIKEIIENNNKIEQDIKIWEYKIIEATGRKIEYPELRLNNHLNASLRINAEGIEMFLEGHFCSLDIKECIELRNFMNKYLDEE